MQIIEIILLSIALAVDCFVVSVSKGIQVRRFMRGSVFMAVCFGVFQALMPCITYFIGRQIYDLIAAYQPYIACALLVGIGLHVCVDALRKRGDVATGTGYPMVEVLAFSVATSIDALSAGVVLLAESLNDFLTDIVLIGMASLLLSLAGTAVGITMGKSLKINVQFIAGVILLALGLWQLV